jgi:cell cycle protein kinase DBF2
MYQVFQLLGDLPLFFCFSPWLTGFSDQSGRRARVAAVEDYVREKSLSEVEASKYRRKMLRSESYYLRLKRQRSNVKDFTVVALIGKGGYGEVYLAKWKTEKNRIVVLKRIAKASTIMKNEVESVKRERDIMSKLTESPWIAKLLMSFQDNDSLFFAMEYCPGGDFRTFLVNCGPCDDAEGQFYFAEMVAAVVDLHALGYIHRDLKPGNFVIEHSGHLKLIDFGLSAEGVNHHLNSSWNSLATTMRTQKDTKALNRMSRTVKQKKEAKEKRRSMVGSPNYMAPEVIAGDGYDHAVDYWSLGVILYEMLVGVGPFEGDTPEEIFGNIWHFQENLVRPSAENDGVDLSDQSWSMIQSLLSSRGTRLGTLDEIKQHEFFGDLDWATLRERDPPFVPQLDNEIDTSYFEVDNVDEANIDAMIKSLEKGAGAGASDRKRNIIAGFTFKPADVEKMRQFQESTPLVSDKAVRATPTNLNTLLDKGEFEAAKQAHMQEQQTQQQSQQPPTTQRQQQQQQPQAPMLRPQRQPPPSSTQQQPPGGTSAAAPLKPQPPRAPHREGTAARSSPPSQGGGGGTGGAPAGGGPNVTSIGRTLTPPNRGFIAPLNRVPSPARIATDASTGAAVPANVQKPPAPAVPDVSDLIPSSPVVSSPVRIPRWVARECSGKVWFKPEMDRQAAELYLKDAAKGCFVVRQSSKPNCVALSHMLASGLVGHAFIQAVPDATRSPPVYYQLENTSSTFGSVTELLASLPLVYALTKKS